ncbi:peptidase family M13 [Teladorsagia circumcincta]|uniref:Peptidase family M13 n=1 Tax=Teladorsagia circumcincta TaxID=45464 RepID=A0A2G9V0Y4_TELCI|nr:peptidase family M13 [Teladorsagia circumcincta]
MIALVNFFLFAKDERLKLRMINLIGAPCKEQIAADDNSTAYQQLSDYLKSTMEMSADPCDDFYQYACGKYIRRALENRASISKDMEDVVYQQITKVLESEEPSESRAITASRLLYQKCVAAEDDPSFNGSAGQFLLQKIHQFGHFPLIHNEEYDEDKFDLTSLLTYFNQNRTVLKAILPTVQVDPRNTSSFAITFDPQRRQSFLYVQALQEAVRSNTIPKMSLRLDLFKNVTYNLLEDDTSSSGNLSAERLNKDLNQILVFERSIYKVPFPNPDDMKDELPLSKVDRMLKSVNWTRYLLSTAPQEVHDYILNDPIIVIPGMEYLKTIDSIISDTPSKVITNYVILRYVNSWAEALDTKYRRAIKAFVESVNPSEEMGDRKRFCQKLTLRKFMEPVTAMYERSRGTNSMKARVDGVIERILSALKSSLEKNSWMKEGTKQKIRNKIASMQKKAVLDTTLTDAYLDEKYKGVEDFMNLTFLGFLDGIGHLETVETFSNLLKPAPNPRSSSTASLDTNAYYNRKLNRIGVPSSFLQFPRFQTEIPESYIYGSLGFPIAHEITNGLNDEGENDDEEEQQSTSSGITEQKEFKESSKCLTHEFDEVLDLETNMTLNGSLTLTKNIADFEGIKHAYKAYQYTKVSECGTTPLKDLEMLNEDRLFFIGFATFGGETWSFEMPLMMWQWCPQRCGSDK